MEHVFLLLIYLGTQDERKLVSGDMYFRSATECNFFAKEMSKRFGNYEFSYLMDSRDRVTAYCVPKFVEEGSVKVY
jgi:hypothetical protein|tara:strand:+ start:67 stop:294 length:228 start_codon:yes stop_codon:yes gene_type:complete